MDDRMCVYLTELEVDLDDVAKLSRSGTRFPVGCGNFLMGPVSKATSRMKLMMSGSAKMSMTGWSKAPETTSVTKALTGL